MSAVQIACVVIVVIATTIGIAVFARACCTIGARMAVGRATAPERLRPVGRRLALTLGALVGHTAFKGCPFVKAAHWLVMVSFPLLFLTLVAGYGQVLGGLVGLDRRAHRLAVHLRDRGADDPALAPDPGRSGRPALRPGLRRR